MLWFTHDQTASLLRKLQQEAEAEKAKQNKNKRKRDGPKEATTAIPSMHQTGSIQQFKDVVDNNNDCINLLDIPTTQGHEPWIIK